MDSHRYHNAPIVEAVIGIGIKRREGVSSTDFAAIEAALRSDYPTRTTLRQLQMGINMAGAAPGEVNVSSKQADVGLRLSRPDQSRLVQIQGHNVTFSHLPPYTDWVSFRDEAKELWSVLRDVVQPEGIARCSVRYVNRFDIPATRIEIEDYFRLYPRVPKELPQELSAMLLRIEMPQPDCGAHAIIHQAFVDAVTPGTVAVLLDIDLVKNFQSGADESLLWSSLESLRERKNTLFEACITDATRKVIQ